MSDRTYRDYFQSLTEAEKTNLPPSVKAELGIPNKEFTPVQQFVDSYLPSWKILRKVFNLDQTAVPEPEFDMTQPDMGGAYSWYNAQLQFELNRRSVYKLVEEMDTYDLNSSVLDIYAEDATQTDYTSGRSVWIETKNDTIKKELIGLFDRLGIEDKVFAICRGMCKYGDEFEQIITSKDKGILSLEYINPHRISRVEDRQGRLIGFMPGLQSDQDLTNAEFIAKQKLSKPWDFIHFRLLSNRRETNHGESILMNARRVWRQLKIIEDALVLYRINRSPDRLVFSVDVGEQTQEDAFRTINRWRRAIRKKIYWDPTEGRMRQEYNPMSIDDDIWLPIRKDGATKVERMQGCFTGETKVKLLNGKNLSFEELHSSYRSKKFWVYSCKPNGEIVPGLAHSPRVTKIAKILVEVELDNDEKIKCTPEHRFMLRDGTYKEAQYLKPDDSLMPLYTKTGNKGFYKGYRKVKLNTDGSWRQVHRVVAEALGFNIVKGRVIHHLDHNSLNNDPSNLASWDAKYHHKYHQKHAKKVLHSPKAKRHFKRAMKKVWHSPEYAEYRELIKNKASKTMKRLLKDPAFRARLRKRALLNCKKNGAKGLIKYNGSPKHLAAIRKLNRDPKFIARRKIWTTAVGRRTGAANITKYNTDPKRIAAITGPGNPRWVDLKVSSILKAVEGTTSIRELARRLKVSKGLIRNRLERAGIDIYEIAKKQNWKNFITFNKINHRVKSIKFIKSEEKVYDITVEQYHNFALESGVFVHNSGVVGDIWDIAHFRDKYFASVRVPKAYMGYEGDINAKSTLSQQDIRFARGVKRIQRSLIYGFTQMARIHLALKNIDPEKKENKFFVRMNPISYLDELQRSELTAMKTDLVSRMSTIGDTLKLNPEAWTRYILHRYLGLTTDEVNKFYSTSPVPDGSNDPSMDLPPSAISDANKEVDALMEKEEFASKAALVKDYTVLSRHVELDQDTLKKIPLPSDTNVSEAVFDLASEEKALLDTARKSLTEGKALCPKCNSELKLYENKKVQSVVCLKCKFVAELEFNS